jgi:hypothetical protein
MFSKIKECAFLSFGFIFNPKYIGSTFDCELEGKAVCIEIISSYECNIYHTDKDITSTTNTANDIETVNINEDDRFKDILNQINESCPKLENHIFLDIQFNKNYFTINELYNYKGEAVRLISYGIHNLTFKRLANRTDLDSNIIKVHIADLFRGTIENISGIRLGSPILETDRIHWWLETFSNIERLWSFDCIDSEKSVISKSIEGSPTVYKYGDNLVYIKEVYNKGVDDCSILLGVIGHNQDVRYGKYNYTIKISQKEAVNKLIPICTINSGTVQLCGMSSLKPSSTPIFKEAYNSIYLYKLQHNGDTLLCQKSFNHIDRVFEFEAYCPQIKEDVKVRPYDIVASYTSIQNKVLYDKDLFNIVYRTLKMLHIYNLYGDSEY